MRKWIILLFASMMFVTYGQAQNKVTDAVNQLMGNRTQQNQPSAPIKMTRADFLKKVANYEKNPEHWKYLGDKPAIVDFYATWCGPCRSISPVLEQLASEYKGKIYVYKVDTDKEQRLSSELGITSLPTLVFIPMKGDPQVVTGAIPKSNFKKIINEVLLKK